MLKKTIFVFLLLLPILLFGLSRISINKLINAKWHTAVSFYDDWSISFKKNGKAQIYFSGFDQGSCYTSSYKIVNNKVVISNFKECKNNPGNTREIKETEVLTCSLIPEKNAMDHIEKLFCSKQFNFKNLTLKVPNGASRVLKGYPVYVYKREMITTWNLVIRSKPTVASKKVFYVERVIKGDNVKDVTRKSIPKGSKVKVLARTTKKHKVGKWSNYWYFIIIQSVGDHNNFEEKEGWVFGEFLK